MTFIALFATLTVLFVACTLLGKFNKIAGGIASIGFIALLIYFMVTFGFLLSAAAYIAAAFSAVGIQKLLGIKDEPTEEELEQAAHDRAMAEHEAIIAEHQAAARAAFGDDVQFHVGKGLTLDPQL